MDIIQQTSGEVKAQEASDQLSETTGIIVADFQLGNTDRNGVLYSREEIAHALGEAVFRSVIKLLEDAPEILQRPDLNRDFANAFNAELDQIDAKARRSNAALGLFEDMARSMMPGVG
jgi:hypothetical protein